MTMNNDPRIFEFLDREAGPVSADYLDELLARTARTRQRPAWASIERWLPMDLTANRPAFGRLIPLRAIAVLAVVALLIAAILTLYIGSRHPLPPPFGLARNGELVVTLGGDIFTIDQLTGVRTPLVVGDTSDFGVFFSRDGTQLAFLQEAKPSGLNLMVANADGTGTRQLAKGVDGLDWADWSPDGRQIAFLNRSYGRGEINIVNLDGTGTVKLAIDRSAHQMAWLANGKELIFRGEQQFSDDPPVAILAIHPDGSGLRIVSTRAPVNDDDFQDISVSQDGRYVGYRDSGPVSGFDVDILDLSTGTERVLPRAPGALGQAAPAFSPDGRTVAYIRWVAESTVQIVVAPLDGSSTGRLIGPPQSSEGDVINGITFAPDGRSIIANFPAEESTRWLPIDGSPGTVLAQGDLTFASWQRTAP